MAADTTLQHNLIKGQALKLLRKARGWTQAELAERVGLSRETVSRWETGEWPDVVTERGLASVFDQPATYFAEQVEAGLRLTSGVLRILPAAQELNEQAIAQVTGLMRAAPDDIEGPFTLEEIQEHLRKQIALFFRAAMPDGVVTLEGIARARDIMRARGVEPLVKKPRS